MKSYQFAVVSSSGASYRKICFLVNMRFRMFKPKNSHFQTVRCDCAIAFVNNMHDNCSQHNNKRGNIPPSCRRIVLFLLCKFFLSLFFGSKYVTAHSLTNDFRSFPYIFHSDSYIMSSCSSLSRTFVTWIMCLTSESIAWYTCYSVIDCWTKIVLFHLIQPNRIRKRPNDVTISPHPFNECTRVNGTERCERQK